MLFSINIGITECGWIFRNNIITPSLSLFDASYNLTSLPIINAKQAWCIPVKNHSLTVNLGIPLHLQSLSIKICGSNPHKRDSELITASSKNHRLKSSTNMSKYSFGNEKFCE